MIKALEGSPASVCDYMKVPAVFILHTTYMGPFFLIITANVKPYVSIHTQIFAESEAGLSR